MVIFFAVVYYRIVGAFNVCAVIVVMRVNVFNVGIEFSLSEYFFMK